MERIVALFVDAFSHSYINKEDTPFLSKQDVHSLTPVFGFKQLAAAFTGLDPLSTGLFAEHYYDAENSRSNWTKLIPSPLLSVMDNFARMPINLLLSYPARRRRLVSKLLPLETAKSFTIDSDPFPESSFIISLLRERRLSYRFIFSPEVKTNKEAFDLLRTLCNSNQGPNFLLVHFPELDPAIHQHGVASSKRKKLVREIDLMIQKVTEMVNKHSHIIIFSDHGMLSVKDYIDIEAKVKTLGLPKNDFILFLDSIMARFWVSRHSTFEKIESFLNREAHGTTILPKKPNMIDKFGHIMFLCSPGYVIFPNYYNSKLPKAMHGYAPEHTSSPLNGMFLASNLPITLTKGKLLMTDIALILRQTIDSL